MPQLDGTGPQGMGPATGRGMGHCGSIRRCFACPRVSQQFISPKNKLSALEEKEKMLEEELAIIYS